VGLKPEVNAFRHLLLGVSLVMLFVCRMDIDEETNNEKIGMAGILTAGLVGCSSEEPRY